MTRVAWRLPHEDQYHSRDVPVALCIVEKAELNGVAPLELAWSNPSNKPWREYDVKELHQADMDDFSDDGFDDLNDNTLQELENIAIQWTQAQKQAQTQATQPQQSSPAYQFTFEDDDLDDAVLIDESAHLFAGPGVGKPFLPGQPRVVSPVDSQTRWQQAAAQDVVPSLPNHHRHQPVAPSRPVPPPLLSQRHPPRPHPHLPPQPLPSQRYPPRQLLPPRSVQPSPQFARPPPQHVPHHAQASQAAGGAGDYTEIIAALQAQLANLQSEITSAKGEASILRSKFEKVQASHETDILRLKKQNAEQLAKQERAIEAATAAQRQANTELQFARQDLKEELGRAKARRNDGAATPKKNKAWGVGDGFDDVEILPSPTKGQAQRRRDPGPVALPLAERTPTRGKRKRSAMSSPAMALETHSDESMVPEGGSRGGDGAASAKPAAVKPRPSIAAFDFLKLVLDHSSEHGQPLTFDLFSRYAFPSDPGCSFASIIFDKLPALGQSQGPVDLLIDFCEMLLDLWNRCINEKYYSPIFDIVALLSFTLQLNTISVAPHIVTVLLPMIQTTCFLVTIPRFNSGDGGVPARLETLASQVVSEIDVTQSLSLLYLSALGCLGPIPAVNLPMEMQGARGSPQVHFWKHIQLEFVLMMLSPKLPEKQSLGMLSLLCTSVLPDSIGPIPNPSLALESHGIGRPPDVETPEIAARALIDRVSLYLADPPKWATRGSVKECRARLAALRTLSAFATSPFGALQLAESTSVIPRLVAVLCRTIDSLYDMDVPRDLWPPPAIAGDRTMAAVSTTVRGESTALGHDPEMTQEMTGTDAAQLGQRSDADVETGLGLLAREEEPEEEPEDDDDGDDMERTRLLLHLVSQTTLLMHTLITDPRTANVINMPAKLATSHGGSHRYLLTLARLTFAEEDLVYEAGIGADTIELAHELLELAVTPDEGEGIGAVFGS